MSFSNGGRWIFSPPSESPSPPGFGFTGFVLGINNGVAPVFPLPQAGALNVEVFTDPNVAGQAGVPNPDAGFQASISDANGTLDAGFLTGANLRLGSGNYLVVDSVIGSANQSPAKITLGTGNQTVVGAKFDTLVGGQQALFISHILSALAGNETVIGGAASNESIWGGANDSIIAGIGVNQQIVVNGPGTTVVAGMGGAARVALAASDTLLSLPGSTQAVFVAAGQNNLIDLTGNFGPLAAVIGASGDTLLAGGGVTNIEGAAGGMLIKIGATGTTAVSGSAGTVPGNTILGPFATAGLGGFTFNPSAMAGKGDLIDLSNSKGTATINAFAFQSTRIASPDTVLATNNADSIFGGDGDRVGTGKGSVVGGTHQWVHADTVAGSAIGFGSNDTVSSTIYDTVGHTATRGTVAGTSSAQVTVGGFDTASDFIFYQNESAATTNAIIATAQATSVAGTPSTIVTLPDGTVMTLVGVTQAQLTPVLFKP